MIAPSPQNLSNDEQELIAAGRDFQDLMESPGYKRLLRILKDYNETALSDLRNINPGLPPHVAQSLVLRWQERDHLFNIIDSTVKGTVEAYRQLTSELGDNYGRFHTTH